MEGKYNHKIVEMGKNKEWIENKVFEADVETDTAKNFSIILPPPNVTGKLHLGHAWDGALQDILIRYKKMQGYNAVWFPGMDHAGIATQAKVETRLLEENIYRKDIGRERFLEYVWEWKDDYAATIKEQWGKLGLGLDYSKEKFTLDPDIQVKVREVFVELYNEGLIYHGTQIVNWDPQLQTVVSDMEVNHTEVAGKFYHLKYNFADGDGFVEVATTRPETIFGDVALAINPEDPRVDKLIDREVIIPGVGRKIPIITDEYVEKDFGTGIVKITPAHDPNDYLVGKRHELEELIVMNFDGTMNSEAGKYVGLDRFVARDELMKNLEDLGLVVKIEDHMHSVGHSDRSGAIIEPMISKQWFLKAGALTKNALDFESNNEMIEFFPPRFRETYRRWMEETLDWCISRQLWWGHQIPVWYHKKTGEVYVGVDAPEDIENYVQDEDVLDTWFSSALWPFAVQTEEMLEKFYPTSVLVTGYDIIFFWVTRMIFQGIKFEDNIPFEKVLIHGLIRDEQGRKMSKSLGNGIDPMDVIEEYGADSLRYFLTTNSTPGQDLRYSITKIESSWNFINKLWNISRFIFMKQAELYTNFDGVLKYNQFDNVDQSGMNASDVYIIERLDETINYIETMMDKYEFTEVGAKLETFIWEDFASWYVEASKIVLRDGDDEDRARTTAILNKVLIDILKMLHPFIPFVTEEIYRQIEDDTFLVRKSYPQVSNFGGNKTKFNDIKEIITAIRTVKTDNSIKPSQEVSIALGRIEENYFSEQDYHILRNLGKIKNIEFGSTGVEDTVTNALTNVTLEINLEGLIDHEAKREELTKQVQKIAGELKRSLKMLQNDKFIQNASEEKIKDEKQKAATYLIQYGDLLSNDSYELDIGISEDDLQKLKNLID